MSTETSETITAKDEPKNGPRHIPDWPADAWRVSTAFRDANPALDTVAIYQGNKVILTMRDEATARQIVRAANCHHALLRATKAAHSLLGVMGWHGVSQYTLLEDALALVERQTRTNQVGVKQ